MAVKTGSIPDKISKRFPDKINFGFTGGPKFFTDIAAGTSGFEQRQVNWEQARHAYNASHEVKTQAELDVLRAFFLAVRGQATAFKFLDWADYSTDMAVQIGTDPDLALPVAGTMTPQDMVNTVNGAVGQGDGTTLTYQCAKTYSPEPLAGDLNLQAAETLTFDADPTNEIDRSAGSFTTDSFAVGEFLYLFGSSVNSVGLLGKLTVVASGTLTTDGAVPLVAETAVNGYRLFSQVKEVTPYVRELKSVINVRPFVDGVEYTEGAGGTGFAVDLDTGIVTFNVAPTANSTVTADVTFEVWTRLNSDDFLAELTNFGLGDWASIDLIEVRL